MENRGLISENRGRAMCRAKKSGVKEFDFTNKKGTVKTENKHTTIKKGNYKEHHDIYNAAHAHKWVLNENGEKDYILTCQAMADEADRIRFTSGATGKEKATYIPKAEMFNFYFCRLAWQCEEHGKLVTNPVSRVGGCKEVPGLAGRRATLQNLINHGVVNVPTFEEIERAYNG